MKNLFSNLKILPKFDLLYEILGCKTFKKALDKFFISFKTVHEKNFFADIKIRVIKHN